MNGHHPPSHRGGGSGRGVSWSNLQDLETVPDESRVYILVFGAGTGSEGVYSLQVTPGRYDKVRETT